MFRRDDCSQEFVEVQPGTQNDYTNFSKAFIAQ